MKGRKVVKGRKASAPNRRILYTNNVRRSLDSGKGIKQGKKHIPAPKTVVLNDRERGGREPALHTGVWGLRHLPARGGRVTWSWEGLGSSAGRGRPVLVEEDPDGPAREGRGAALGVVRSMGGAKPPLGALGRE